MKTERFHMMEVPYLDIGTLTDEALGKVPVGDYFIYASYGYRVGLKVTPRYMIPMPGSGYRTIEQAQVAAEQYCKREEFPMNPGRPLDMPVCEKDGQICAGTTRRPPITQEQTDLLDKLKETHARLEEAKARNREADLLKDKTVVTCVYCGQEYPDGTPTAKAQILTDHIKVCLKHPMRAAEQRIKELEAALKTASVDRSNTTIEEVIRLMAPERIPQTAADIDTQINNLHAEIDKLHMQREELNKKE